MSVRVFIGLGSNLGERLAILRSASAQLAALPGYRLVACSRAHATRPLGPGTGPFLNAALELHAAAADATPDPEALLDALLRIEQAHGRVRRERWGDRTLDLDLLAILVDTRELAWASERLSLPHPGALERDFVLVPLLELDAELALAGIRCADALARVREPTLLDLPAAPLLDP
jgi:2-amino-4-hydroxy-6-hydroxymethyldihydropteridine diphosphokinase